MESMPYEIMEAYEKLKKLVSNQSELARISGIAQSEVNKILKGERRLYLDVALKLAKSLGVSLDYLADPDVNEPPKPEVTSDERQMVKTVRDMKLEPSRVIYLIRLGLETEREIENPDIGPGFVGEGKKRKLGG